MDLSRTERLILANQYRILEALFPADADYYRDKRTALEHGFEYHYDEVAGDILSDTLSAERCNEVIEILQMYRSLTYAYRALEDKSGIEPRAIDFPGFDGNHET